MTFIQERPFKPFGHELLLDLYDVKDLLNPKHCLCDDIEFTYRFLEDMVVFLGMTPMAPPYVIHAPSKINIQEGVGLSGNGPVDIFNVDREEVYPDKAGVSAWQPLIESGIQIHTLAPKRFVSIDIYTCGKLEVDKVKRFVEYYYNPSKIEEKYVIRGKEYSES